MAENSLTNSLKSTLTVLDDCVKLEHTGVGAVLFGIPRGEKTIFYDDFTSVEFKPNKLLSTGYIQFNIPGHKQKASLPENDEYSFSFDKKIEYRAEKLYNKILENKRNHKSSGDTTVINQVSAADEVLKLKQLLDAGVLTQDEFDTKKKQLLGL